MKLESRASVGRAWNGWRALVALLAGLASAGCGDEEYYLVSFAVVGPEANFEGRSIRIQGREALPEATEAGDMKASVSLCTTSQEKFLNTRIEVVVTSADETPTEVLVERVACKFDEIEGADGKWEENAVYLEEDASIVATFGDDPRATSECRHIPSDCRSDDL